MWLYYWYYRKRYSVPHPGEFKGYFPKPLIRKRMMTFMYKHGSSIEEIAEAYNVTRERVRQCIWNQYREMRRE